MHKFLSIALTIVSTLGFAELFSQQKSSDSLLTSFHLGSHLFRLPKPPDEELVREMAILKEKGFDLIKIQTHWAYDERVEGEYDFSPYERALQEADRLGMKVYIGFTLEQAPQWLYTKYPDCRMVGRDGLPVKYETQWTLPADGKPGPSYFHPGAMEAKLRYLKKAVSVLGKHKSVAIWNTWQEVAYWAERTARLDIDYNPYTIAYFSKWLQARFKSIDSLNKSWGSTFASWDQVGPTRMPTPIGSGQDQMWEYFLENEYYAYVLRARYKAIKDADELKRPVFAHKSAPSVGSGQDWTFAECQDFLGSSSYPGWSSFSRWDDYAHSRKPVEKYSSLLHETWNNLALNFDYLRSANEKGKPVWAAEFQGGPISSNFQKGRVPSPDDIRRWMLTVVGSGVTTISYWVTRAEIIVQEHNGFGLLNSEGNTTPRLEEAGRVGKALMQYPALFGRPTKPAAEIGIIVDENNYRHNQVIDGIEQHLRYSLRGWYRFLWDMSVPVDFINIQDIDEKTAAQYKALILPFPLSLSDTAAKRLLNYVNTGGNIVSEAGIGRITENGFNVRGEINPLIRSSLGISQTNFQMVAEPATDRRWMPDERTWGEFLPATKFVGVGEFAGDSVLANYYVQTFDAGQATPILKMGDQTAGVMRKIGKGRFILLGTFIGHNATAYENEGTKNFVGKLLQSCNVQRQNKGNLLLRKRVAADQEAWVLTNPLDKDVTETIDVSAFKDVRDLLGEKLPVQGKKVEVTVKSLDVRVLILKK